MGRKSRTAVLKRQREVRKSEKAAMKREKRVTRESADTGGQQVATSDDLAGYGFDDGEEAAEEAEAEPPGSPGRATASDRQAPPFRWYPVTPPGAVRRSAPPRRSPTPFPGAEGLSGRVEVPLR
jgi:hypothetical protein